jgi:hypothetical protein
MSRKRTRKNKAQDRERLGNLLSPSKAVVLERADCCLACIKRSRSRWGKHPDKKPAYKNHRRQGGQNQWHSQDA